jgi:hypothetical protein
MGVQRYYRHARAQTERKAAERPPSDSVRLLVLIFRLDLPSIRKRNENEHEHENKKEQEGDDAQGVLESSPLLSARPRLS